MATKNGSTPSRQKSESAVEVDPRQCARTAALRALPFVRDRPGMHRCFWAPQPVYVAGGEYGDDCLLGQRYAEAYMRMREEHDPHGGDLQHVVLDMLGSAPGDSRPGLIVGFFSALDDMLRIAAAHGGVAALVSIRRRYLDAMVRSYAQATQGAVDTARDEAA